MKYKTLTTVLAISIISLSSCYDSTDNSTPIVSTEKDAPILVSTAITGSLTDATDIDLTGYTIHVGDLQESVETKKFVIQTENVNKNGQAIYAKDGSEIISLLHTPLIENDINLIKLQAFDPMNTTLISSSDPDRIDISPYLSLEITADMTRDEQGNIPTQDVYLHHRDLSTLNNISQLGVSAYDSKDQLRATEHISAFQISIADNNGIPYQLEDNAIMHIELNSTDTRDISLFHFDSDAERWDEVKSLSQGSNTVAIDASGFYTISTHIKAVYGEGDVNRQGNKVSYQMMSLDQLSRMIYSTAKGKWLSIIPADQEVRLSTMTPCGVSIQDYDIPTSHEKVSGIDIEVTQGNYYKLQTKVYDCNGDLENISAIYLKDNDQVGNIYPFTDENVDTYLSVCEEEFDLSTYDIDTDKKGPSIPWSVNIVDNQNYFVSCNDSEYENGYSYIKIRNDKAVLPPFATIKVDNSTTLQSIDNNIQFKFMGQEAANYNSVNLFLNREEFGGNDSGYFVSCLTTDDGCGFTYWNVTHYEAGEEKWVRVSFAGEVWMQTISPPEAGYFPVEGVILTQAN